MRSKTIIGLLAFLPFMLAAPVQAEFWAISAYNVVVDVNENVDPPKYMLQGYTFQGYSDYGVPDHNIPVDALVLGQSTGVANVGVPPEFVIENNDDFDLNTFVPRNGADPAEIQVRNFGGSETWQDTNGEDKFDFFIWEVGANDQFAVRPILPGDVLGEPVVVSSKTFRETGGEPPPGIKRAGAYNTGQVIGGIAFKVTDLLDENGNALTNDAVILGLEFSSGGMDVASVHATLGSSLASEPSPADGGVSSSVCPVLQWKAGADAVSHKVYFSDNFDDVNGMAESALIGTTAETSLDVCAEAYPDGLLGGVYYWRVVTTDDQQNEHPGAVWTFIVTAGMAFEPTPADQSLFVNPYVTLMWNPGANAIEHTVIIDTDREAVAAATDGVKVTVLSYTPAPLQQGVTYYWRVDEFDGTQTVKGEIWSFTTVPAGAGGPITFKEDVSDTYESTALTWKTADFTGTNKAGTGTATIGFGAVAPAGYTQDADQVYPLVLYLHGASARGSYIARVLKRQTPRYFAQQAQITPEFAAFVVAPQVPSSDKFVDMPWNSGPYEQNESTYTDSMCLIENLVFFLCDPSNNTALAEVLGLDADDIDKNRIYVVGDSMGAFGTWDIVARQPGLFAAAITSSGNGPKNKLEEIKQTPLWAIHGIGDSTVPNKLPSAGDVDGDGSLAMLVLLDPGFDNTSSTDMIKLDNYAISEDDPNVADTLVYSEFPSNFGHGTVAVEWTTRVSGTAAWLFSHSLPVLPEVGPIDSMVADANGIILSINGIDTSELVLGTTTFPDPPTHADPNFHADKADNFELSNGASGDNQPFYDTMFSLPVSTVFLIENNGNDSGYFVGLDIDGNEIGSLAVFTKNEDYLKFDEYRFFLGQQASGIMFVPPHQVYGIRIIKPDHGALGFDALSTSAVPVLTD